MSRYSYFNLLKRQAKALARAREIRLNIAQQQLATQAGFRHFHELQTVARANPDDGRLMRAALGTDDLKEVIYEDALYQALDSYIEDELSADIAGTNAYLFTIEDFYPEFVTYDQKTGILTIEASLSYEGEQDPDRVYAGNIFYLEVVIQLFRAVDHWKFADDDGVIVTSIKSDQDLDWEEQRTAEGKIS
jgi:hypothetical protein